MEKQLLTVEEVAQKIRRKPFTVRKYLREGVIPGIKLNDGTWLVKASDLEAFINAGYQKPEER